MKKGQKLVCIVEPHRWYDTKDKNREIPRPQKGEIVTFYGYSKAHKGQIKLEEYDPIKYSWNPEGFVPIQEGFKKMTFKKVMAESLISNN